MDYNFLYPALLFSSSAGASWEFFSVASMVWAILGAMFVMSGILLLLRPRLTRNDASFTSVFQGSLRFTSYIGFAAAFSLFGNEGLYLAAVFITVMITSFAPPSAVTMSWSATAARKAAGTGSLPPLSKTP